MPGTVGRDGASVDVVVVTGAAVVVVVVVGAGGSSAVVVVTTGAAVLVVPGGAGVPSLQTPDVTAMLSKAISLNGENP